ncbi:hypothetical protein GXP67_21190 [Rhodocytophaga rosea]|uniref:Uncharacterized protein n=1 Tax=Rhodocytophaga rosea TaxID=2704465 RepID=A0A6C0GLS6_9BACT|nr:hypothetical protein [Rhodocytophaga rosea]QHT68986.1 hypothetical protein GXP67_21190 [Rhodocytophaga rosea]
MENSGGDLSTGMVMGRVDKTKLTSEVRERQATFISVKHMCIRVAETLNDILRQVLLEYYDVFQRPNVDQLYTMDFMKLRDTLSDIIQKDHIFHNIEILKEKHSRKEFTRTFAAFIEDRNIYTHGHLHIRVNDDAVIITSIDKQNSKQIYWQVNQEIIQSFFDTYIVLKNVIFQISQIILKHRKRVG